MISGKTEIWVYAHWIGMSAPKLIGLLSAIQIRGKKSFSFEYDPDWIKSSEQILLDPDIQWHKGPQFSRNKSNFGIFLDSMPDTWGRKLMKKRAAIISRELGAPNNPLDEIDFLLGVYDECRMGAIRFKLSPQGPFLDNNPDFPTPPWMKTRELQHSAEVLEKDDGSENMKQWLAILMAPGSSLGGARPKANVMDTFNNLWIAKFPSISDSIDKGLWEFLAYKLALKAGINMSPSKIEKISGIHHTFFTSRFDRLKSERIHFASAMTMTGHTESDLRSQTGSYLEIAEFIQFTGYKIRENLHQLWRRIIFNIAISNTDDHFRNHGFLLTGKGWILSPAFDLNPSVDKNGLALNIDFDDNALDFELAKSVGAYFQLDLSEMNQIIEDVRSVISQWRKVATEIGISRKEQEEMEPAFKS